MKCRSLGGCPNDAKTRGYCEAHYRRRLHIGLYGYRDATVVTMHVNRLRELGWTFDEIDDASDTNSVAHALIAGYQTRILSDTAEKLLSVPLQPRTPKMVLSVGTLRRVRALGCMGWAQRDVAQMAGVSHATLSTVIYRERMSAEIAEAVAAVYRRVSSLHGGNAATARRAKRFGFDPPIAWDYTDIDDPAAKPYDGFRSAA